MSALIQQAYCLAKQATDWLVAQDAQCIERAENAASGVVCERWHFPNGVSLWLYATPDFWELLNEVQLFGTADSKLLAAAEWVKP